MNRHPEGLPKANWKVQEVPWNPAFSEMTVHAQPTISTCRHISQAILEHPKTN